MNLETFSVLVYYGELMLCFFSFHVLPAWHHVSLCVSCQTATELVHSIAMHVLMGSVPHIQTAIRCPIKPTFSM
jgi:hypothetical protein